MKKVFAGALITIAAILVYRSCTTQDSDGRILMEQSMLIEEQFKNVAKLIVTEGHYSEVYNYADSKELFGPLITANKKALVVVNAEVLVTYDLSVLVYEIDTISKIVRINHIPEPEIKINPDFEYYDVTADYFNPFNADDYNLIKRNVNASLLKKVEKSSLLSNAENRLISELSNILALTNAMGWTLVYEKEQISNMKALETLVK